MVARIATIDAVVTVGIIKLAEIFVSLYQRLCILVRVLRMNIVIGCAVAEEQSSMELLSTHNGAHIIAIRVLLRCAHVTFSIDRVVEAPACGRRNCHTRTEHATSLAHAHEGVEATVAPSPYSYAVLVDETQRTELEPRHNLL